jgi:hypothetical protein
MRAPAILPGVPVADEYSLVKAAGRFSFLDGVESLLCARYGVAVREDFHGEGEVLSIGRYDQIAEVERQVRELLRFTTIDLDAPYLG